MLCLRIPRWVESTAGEVPAALRSTAAARSARRPISRGVLVALWGNGAIRVLTGFLTLFVAFVVKAQHRDRPAAASCCCSASSARRPGSGSFVGNAIGSRRRFGHSGHRGAVLHRGRGGGGRRWPRCCPGSPPRPLVALVAATASALAKVCLDAVIQRDLPEESRASAFGRSETVLQLAWVFGGALGRAAAARARTGSVHRGRRGGGAGRAADRAAQPRPQPAAVPRRRGAPRPGRTAADRGP